MAEHHERIFSLIRRGGRDAYLAIEDKNFPILELLFTTGRRWNKQSSP